MTHPYWPFFDLRVCTPRLELRYPDDHDVTEVMSLAARGIHPPDFMPFGVPWTRFDNLERQGMQFHWRARADLTPEHWDLPLVAVVDGVIVGTQSVSAKDFAVARTVGTGSWVGQAHQGQGIGKEMRAAVLHLAFEGLGAQTATSGAFVDNAASIAVSRALGYEDDGFEVHARDGQAARQVRFRLERAEWEARRRHDIVIEGLERCLGALGLGGS
ncbi:MAG TPA: GNAT family protein [Acidimicrobiales bacterium]|jgi:RimJ/RimL family protein N-acetyltransferase|nr:GNAT family protein [Acidimicrobiales bacterium]